MPPSSRGPIDAAIASGGREAARQHNATAASRPRVGSVRDSLPREDRAPAPCLPWRVLGRSPTRDAARTGKRGRAGVRPWRCAEPRLGDDPVGILAAVGSTVRGHGRRRPAHQRYPRAPLDHAASSRRDDPTRDPRDDTGADLLDVSPRLNDKQLKRAVNNALHSPWLTEDQLAEALTRHPTAPGTRRIAKLIGLEGTPPRSGWEDDFPAFCQTYGLPAPGHGRTAPRLHRRCAVRR